MSILKFGNYIKENNHYEETSWTSQIDGKEVTISISELEEYLKSISAPIKKLKVDKIFPMCIHKDKSDIKTKRRSESSSLRYPIIIAKGLKGEFTMILDGHHRLLKAKNMDKEFIRAKVLDLKKAPKYYQQMFK